MEQFFGDFRDDLPTNQQFLMISFSPSSLPLQKLWRNNGLSADFVADYLTTFLPTDEEDPRSFERQAELKGAVSYIANELLENAMKFHEDSGNLPIQLAIYLLENTVILCSSNCISQERQVHYQDVIETLITQNPEFLYIEHLERLAEAEDNKASGLGLLTIINDYGAKLGWKFVPLSQEYQPIKVTTMVQISL